LAPAPKTSGVYVIQFKDGRVYVGASAKDIHERLHAAFTDKGSAVNAAGLTKDDVAGISYMRVPGSWQDVRGVEQQLINQYGGIGNPNVLNRRNELG
jgi:hypothetical protein